MNFVSKSLFFYFFIILQTAYGQSFVNGDLENPGGSSFGTAAPGWTLIPVGSPITIATATSGGTTDIVDINGPNIGLWGYYGNPQSGATFVGGILSENVVNDIWHEGFQQSVNCFTPGWTYEISFYQSVVKYHVNLDQSGAWSLYADNNIVGTSAISTSTLAHDDPNLNWDLRTINFTATAATHTLQFVVADDDNSLQRSQWSVIDLQGALTMGIDNLSITPVNPQITPAGATICTTDPPLNLGANVSGGTWSGTGITNPATGTFDPAVSGTGSHQIIYTINGACGNSIADTVDIVVSCALPVELLTFNAQAVNDERVALTWTTVNEINNDFFEIERSRDGTSFGTIATVDGAGNSNITLHYNDFDEDPYNGVSYYRLKQTDFDGTYTYSDIRTVVFDDLSFVNMYPNPAEDDLQFTVLVSEDADLHVHIVDVTGRVIMTENHRIEAGESTITLNVSNIASGMYTIRVNTNDENHLSKEFIRR